MTYLMAFWEATKKNVKYEAHKIVCNSFEKDHHNFPLVIKNEVYNKWDSISGESILNPHKALVFFRRIGAYSLFKALLTALIK